MADTRRLLDAHAQLTAAIRASEPWEASYKQSRSAFRRLIAEEAALQSAANEYLVGLSERVPGIVNWSEVPLKQLQASAVPPQNDETWKNELAFLTALLAPHILELFTIGANAGEEAYGIPLGITSYDEAIINAADKYTAALVSQVTATTRRYIQQAIKQSIVAGEDATQTIERIRRRVSNPVRAEMIAQTESVNAYQTGLDHFAVQSGAISSTWEALLGACRLCAPLDGVTKPIGEAFELANGDLKLRPPGHVRCRCGRYLNYPE